VIEGAIASAVDSCRNKFARHCFPPSIPPKVLLGTGSAKSVPCGCGEDLARGALCLACQETPPHESIAAQILTLYSHPIHIGLQLRLQSFERDRGKGSFDCAHHDTTGDQGFVCPAVREDSKVSSRRGRALYTSTCTRRSPQEYLSREFCERSECRSYGASINSILPSRVRCRIITLPLGSRKTKTSRSRKWASLMASSSVMGRMETASSERTR